KLVDEGLVPGGPRGAIVAPGKRCVKHHGQGRIGGAVAIIKRKVSRGVAYFVTPEFIMPLDVTADRLRVRIQNNLVGIEAVTVGRLVGPMDTITVKLTRLRIRQITMPDLIGLFRQSDTLIFLGVLGVVKEA